MRSVSAIVCVLLLSSPLAMARHPGHARAPKPIETNAVEIASPPAWLKSNRVDRVVDHIQEKLDWDIRKIHVVWWTDQAAFEKMHGYGPTVLALSRKADNSIQVGPRVTTENFDEVFGHELVHIIIYQKYKDSIPKWLEEGLANYLSKHGHVDYPWLAKQPPVDVRTLVHPFSAVTSDGKEAEGPKFHYQASTALAEMIAHKCDLEDLLQLSTGEKLEGYLSTYCEIKDLNAEFRKWVTKKAKSI